MWMIPPVYFSVEKGRLKSIYINFKHMANKCRVVFFRVNRLLLERVVGNLLFGNSYILSLPCDMHTA